MATKTNKKSSSFLFNFYVFLGALQAATIIFWVLALFVWLPGLSDTTAVGANLVLGLTFPLSLLATCVLAVVTLVGLSVYMFRQKLQGKKRTLGFIVLAISLIPVGFGLYMTYQQTVVMPAERQRFEREREERELEYELEERSLIEELRSAESN